MSAIPSAAWRALARRARPRRLPKGLDAVWNAGLGVADRLRGRRRALLADAARVVAMEQEFEAASDASLRESIDGVRSLFRLGRETEEDLLRGLALAREAAWRAVGQRAYAVQVAAALAVERGCVAEMATGEGKTLAAALAAVLAGWRGRGCHVVTANDYLAARDADWTGPIYRACGVTVGCVREGDGFEERCAAYGAGVTYCTSKQAAADFLRDRLALGRSRTLPEALLDAIAPPPRLLDRPRAELMMRGLECAIVDEADSVLIDEAVTPLILSGAAPNEDEAHAYRLAAQAARELIAGRDFRVDARHNDLDLTEAGAARVHEMSASWGGVWAGVRRAEELVVQALSARELYHRGKQYLVADGKVVIVDEFTGRVMPDRTWRDGMHQAIEAKEGLTVTGAQETLARISFQRFFRLYRRLAGMTGTAAEARGELWQIYRLPVVRIPTHRACARRQRPDRVFATEAARWTAVAGSVGRLHGEGRPVLIGVRSVAASERVSEMLTGAGIPHSVLNAERHRDEAAVIARAGEAGRVTVATNMAGRGTDIKPGEGVTELGGLHVIATERHAAGRIDRQLFGRTGRQGDPGSAQAVVSLEDDIVRKHAPLLGAAVRGVFPGETPRWIGRMVVRLAQRRSERLARRQRLSVLRADDWLDESLGFAGEE